MKIYLMRHGDALNADEDSQRPLSEKGQYEVQQMAVFLQQNHIEIAQIYHSGKLRAQQTAEYVKNALHKKPALETLTGLLPDDDVKSIAVYCNHWYQEVMLVGHLPFLGRLVSLLLCERDDLQLIGFQTASIVCLERIALFQWCISWALSPLLISH